MIYVCNKLCDENNVPVDEQRRFLDDEVESAIGTFKALVRKANASYVCIEWIKNTRVLLPDRDDPNPLDAWGT